MAGNAKRKVSQRQIARACGLNQGTVSRILDPESRGLFLPETIERVLQKARELGYLHPTLVPTERRDSVRHNITVQANVRFVLAYGSLVTSGTAETENVSRSGMLLRSFKLDEAVFPLEPYRIELEVTSAPLRGFTATCKPIRIVEGEKQLGIAVRYETVNDESKELIHEKIA
jgi:hypothetical protein